MRKPYYVKRRKAWFVKTTDGKSQVRLHEDEKEAHRLWNQMQAANQSGSTIQVAPGIAQFLKHVAGCVRRDELSPSILRAYQWHLADFANLYGESQCVQLAPSDLTRWLDAHPTWGTTSRSKAIGSVKRFLNWHVEEGNLTTNPLALARKPSPPRREHVISDKDHQRLMAAIPRPPSNPRAQGAFRAVLIALRHSGVRPGTIAAVQAEHVAADLSCWVLPKHKTRRKTGKPLVVYLSPYLQLLTRILLHFRPTGHLFLNARGTPWKPDAIARRFRRLRQRIGLPVGTVAYAYRHSFTTSAMLNGVDVATVAELLGHGNLTMIQKHYGHLTGAVEHLKAAAAKATRSA